MLIGIMSDSHEQLGQIEKAIKVFNNRGVEHIYHAGDIISPITYPFFKKSSCKIDFVFGNNDGEKEFLIKKFEGFGVFHNRFYEFEIKNKKFIMLHEPDLIEKLLKSNEYDCIIYGHTHVIDIQEGNTLVINPGEAGGILKNRSTIVILDIDSMKPEVIDI